LGKPAHVEYDKCLPTAWKYRGRGKKKDKDGALYDLTTNPEEDPKQFGNDPLPAYANDDNGRLNCLDSGAAGTKVYDTQLCLQEVALRWKDCINDNNREGGHCEVGAGVSLPPSGSCAP